MRRFERGERGEARFWNLELAGKRVILRHGKVGGRAREQVVPHPSEVAAHHDARARMAQKLREGYLEAQPPPGPPLQQALESALAENPDDLSAHMAYADWLSEQGDPLLVARGEFIGVQLNLERADLPEAQRKKLQKKETELRRRHGRAWLGALGTVLPPLSKKETWGFARGWLGSLRIRSLTVDLARLLARSPEVRLLRTLHILDCDFERAGTDFPLGKDVPEDEIFPALYPLRSARHFDNLRTLYIGDLGNTFDSQAEPNAAPVPKLLARMPRLRELGIKDLSATVPIGQLLRCKEFKQLHTLQLMTPEFGEEACRILARSGLPEGLKVLELRRCALDDDGARALAACPGLARLERLDVSENGIGPEGVEVLKQTGVPLVAEDMSDAWEDEEFDDDWE
jgi:uncharacterized protein (TIGR02996 family)